MSVLVKNKQRLTPRQYAQRIDRFKFHRVIKYLRELEEKEEAINTLLDEDAAGDSSSKNPGVKSLGTLIKERKEFSLAMAALLGVLLFIIDKILVLAGTQ